MSRTPKILYVEDELATNIPRLFLLFKKFLGEAEQKRLEELDEDLEGYGADPEEIKQIFTSIKFIDIEYRFPDALSRILNQADEYSLFIIDRNLAGAEYTVEEVQNLDPQYSEDTHAQYFQREGDYLLVKLVTEAKVSALEERFYFLTAFPGQDEIRGIQKIKNRIDLAEFQRKNFIEKGDRTALQLLRSAIGGTDL